ncbi:hypothetical protein ACHAXS_001530 [Conticribra weissflogii]
MAEKKINTVEGMGAWDVVEREDDMNVINGTWAFKCKQFSNSTVKKFKTYAPVVQWTTDCLMLILENLLGLKSKQADVTTAFFMLLLEKTKKSIWILCFKQHRSNGTPKVLCLKNLWLVSKFLSHLEVSH